MSTNRTTSVALAAAMALACFSGTATAAENQSQQRRDRIETVGPNRAMLRSGVIALGVGYVPSAIVAIQSSLPADDKLLIPVAGPWMDYGTRECPTCKHETMNKALLITDGIVQGLGALQIAGSFLFLETRTSESTQSGGEKRRGLQIAPARLGGGYGVTARGYF